MGAYFLQGRTSLILPRESEPLALSALKQADREHYLTGYARSPVQSARSLEDAIAAAGWHVHRDAQGTIDLIVAQEPRKCYEDAEIRLLDALAPFVKAGSSLVLHRYELDEPPYLHTFDGKARHAAALDEDDPETKGLLEEPNIQHARKDKPVPSWNDAKKSMPAVGLHIYSMADGYEEGQWIAHPKLGPGLVLGMVEDKKMRVLFESGERLLARKMA
jgi:hypothetical protein